MCVGVVRYFETGGAPVDELDGPFALHRSNCRIDVLGYDVAAVQQTNGHVFPFAWVALEIKKKKVPIICVVREKTNERIITLTIWLLGSKQADVISATLSCS